jgi:mercuric ion binding protein
MTKLQFAAASAALLFNTASFGAERTVTLAVENMTCSACPHIVKGSLAAVPGVSQVLISFKDKTATVTYDDAKAAIPLLVRATTDADIPPRRRAEAAYVRVQTGLDAHLSCLRASSIRSDAHGLLPIFLRMCWMQNSVEAEGRRLLRVLFVRRRAMSVDSRSAGERSTGVLLLIKRSLIP